MGATAAYTKLAEETSPPISPFGYCHWILVEKRTANQNQIHPGRKFNAPTWSVTFHQEHILPDSKGRASPFAGLPKTTKITVASFVSTTSERSLVSRRKATR